MIFDIIIQICFLILLHFAFIAKLICRITKSNLNGLQCLEIMNRFEMIVKKTLNFSFKFGLMSKFCFWQNEPNLHWHIYATMGFKVLFCEDCPCKISLILLSCYWNIHQYPVSVSKQNQFFQQSGIKAEKNSWYNVTHSFFIGYFDGFGTRSRYLRQG